MLLDFETRSRANLKTAGAYRYARDPSTRVLMFGYGTAENPEIWFPWEPIPREVREHAEKAAKGEAVFHAHNANFERQVWNQVLRKLDPTLPELPAEAFDCSMARAAADGWPLKLSLLGKAMGLDQIKDTQGSRVLNIVSNAAKTYTQAQFDIVTEYCLQDIRTEGTALPLLRPLTKAERKVWLLDQKINDRGVQIDVAGAQAVQEAVRQAREKDEARLRKLTGGAVQAVTQVPALRAWCNERLTPLGWHLPDMKAETVERFLQYDDIPEEVRLALQIRADAGGAAVKKLDAMLACVGDDGRARGLLAHHAANTGRWGGRLIQPQNFPRPSRGAKITKNIVGVFASQGWEDIDAWYPGGVYAAASDALRPLLTAAPGNILRRADLSAIEARLVLWLAGHDDAMDIFRSGACIYCEQASATYGRPIVRIKGQDDPPERQNGKVIVLGCGYQMGPARYIEHAAGYGLNISAEQAERDVYSYRNRWWRVPAMWREFQKCAWKAFLEGGVHEYRGIQFAMQDGALCVRLHSGRILRWQGVHTDQDEDDERPSLYAYRVDKGQWKRVSLYGGIITERVTQATARDVIVHGMLLAEDAGLPAVLSVHDEAVTDVQPSGPGLGVLVSCLATTPRFLPGLPLAADGAEGFRYGK